MSERVLSEEEKRLVRMALRRAADECRRSAATILEHQLVIPPEAAAQAATEMGERAVDFDRLATAIDEAEKVALS